MRNLWLLFLVGLFLSEPLFVFSQSSSTDDLYIEGRTSGDFPIDDEDGDDGSGSGSGDYTFSDSSNSEEKLWMMVNFTKTSFPEEMQPLQPQPTADSAHNPATTAAARPEPEATVKDSEKTPFVSSDGNSMEKEVPGIGPTVGSPRSTVRPPIKTTAAEFGVNIGVDEDLDEDNSLDRWNFVTPKDEVLIEEIENGFEVAVGRGGRLNDPPKEVTSENLWERTEVLAAVIACGVVGFLCAVFLLLLLAYRMKKKDEGSYDLGDTKLSSTAYHKAPTKEFYA